MDLITGPALRFRKCWQRCDFVRMGTNMSQLIRDTFSRFFWSIWFGNLDRLMHYKLKVRIRRLLFDRPLIGFGITEELYSLRRDGKIRSPFLPA